MPERRNAVNNLAISLCGTALFNNLWGTPYLANEHAVDKLLARIYTKRVSHVIQRV